VVARRNADIGQDARMTSPTRVYLEQGTTWTFACAVDWPGWCRRGKGDAAALEALLGYTDRYGAAVSAGFAPGEVEVVGTLAGGTTTDFGAPEVSGPWDGEPLDAAEGARQTGLLTGCWEAFDAVVGTAPGELRKGPRGGGRDRDEIVAHVQEAERSYARKVGVRLPPRTPWEEQRAALVDALGHDDPSRAWPARYALRRIAWHVLDHAWEIQDKS
jgi:hypothetical protein